MFERDKNHPAIILWSLGNESGELAARHVGSARHVSRRVPHEQRWPAIAAAPGKATPAAAAPHAAGQRAQPES